MKSTVKSWNKHMYEDIKLLEDGTLKEHMAYQSQIKEWLNWQLLGAKGNLNGPGAIIKWRHCPFQSLTWKGTRS